MKHLSAGAFGGKSFRRTLALILAVTLMSTMGVTALTVYAGEETPVDQIYDMLAGTVAEPKTALDYEELADIDIAKSEYAAALENLETARSLTDAMDTGALANLWVKTGSVYALQEDYETAQTCLASALECDADSSQALLLRGSIALAQGEVTSARDDLARYMELVPDDVNTGLTLAQLYESEADFAAAGKTYADMYASGKDDSYWLNAMRCQFLEGKYEETMVAFDTYLGLIPDESAENIEGTAENGEETKAMLPETPVINEQTNPVYIATARFLRAACLMQMSKWEEAMTGYEEALADGYDAAACHEQIAACQYEMEDYENMVKTGESMLAAGEAAVSPDLLRQRIGTSYLQLGDYAKAEENLTEALNLNRELPGTYYYRGVVQMSLEKYDEAIEDFTASIEQGFLVQFCYYNRGVCRVQKVDYETALDDFRQTLASGDDESLIAATKDILWQLADYYKNLEASSATAPEIDIQPETGLVPEDANAAGVQ